VRDAIRGSAAALSIAIAICTAAVLRTSAQQRAPRPVESELDIPPIPGDVARALTFGFRSLLADFTLLQAIQLLPARHGDMAPDATAQIDRRMFRLLEYSVEVDRKFGGAYRFAATALPHETMDGKAFGVVNAMQILEKGARERPDDWRMGFLLGFLQSYYLRDFPAAARNLAHSAKQQGAPPWVGLLATRLAAQGGELQLATSLAEAMHVERDLRAIEDAAQRYRETHGYPARSVQALVSAGFLPVFPREPHGGRYVLEGDGTARSTSTERLRAYGLTNQFEVH